MGPDVEQLQEALAGLPFGASDEQVVSGILDEQTALLVNELYNGLGYQPARNIGDDPDLVLLAAEVAFVANLPSTVVASPPRASDAFQRVSVLSRGHIH